MNSKLKVPISSTYNDTLQLIGAEMGFDAVKKKPFIKWKIQPKRSGSDYGFVEKMWDDLVADYTAASQSTKKDGPLPYVDLIFEQDVSANHHLEYFTNRFFSI